MGSDTCESSAVYCSAAGGADENTSDSVSDDKRDNASTGFFAGKFFGIKLTFVVVAIIVSLLAIVAVLAALAIIHANKAKHDDDEDQLR